MATLCPYPRFKAVDASGVPYSGGKLYTYRAGTSTATAVYTDAACTTAAANPVVLDSAGEATIYLKGKYKFTLKTSADVTVWTLDGVQGMGDWQEGALYADYNETDQGATGNGASIKALVDAIGSENATIVLAHNSGGTTTTYTLSTSETIPANIQLRIEKGAKITIDAAKTLTINGQIDAGNYEIFTGTGTLAGTPVNTVWDFWGTTWINSGLTDSMTRTDAPIHSRQIDINPLLTAFANTNWSTISYAAQLMGGQCKSTGAQNAEVSWNVVLQAGTWNVDLIHVKDADVGIYSVQFDDVAKGTIDGYAAAPAANAQSSVTGITVSVTKTIELSLKMLTKNASSSSYYGNIQWVRLIRTA